MRFSSRNEAMLKHVLTATDLSASSMDPVERGFLISKATGARYTILHAANLTLSRR